MDELLAVHIGNLEALGVETSNANIYTQHQLGEGRAKRYFEGTLTKDDVKIMWKNVYAKGKQRDNAKTKNTDKEQVIKEWNDKFRGGNNGHGTV